MLTLRILLQVAILMSCAAIAAADTPKVRIVRVSEPPVLEDYLDGKVVPPGLKLTGFVQREPGDNVPVSQPTDAYLSYDANQLYVVFVCHDDPTKIRARMSKREAILSDEVVGIILDTYHDKRRAYEFLANPLGIQLDGVTTEGENDDFSFDTLWKSDGRLTSFGYVVLMQIPFKSLRFSASPDQTWGFAVARIIVRNNETSFWPYVTRKIASFGPQLAVLEGLSGISPGRNLQAIPYGTFSGARFLDEQNIRRSDNTIRAGVDAKAVVKDSVTVDLTVNPDFSQVESDEPQVTVNQRFEVFFPEKRPFFIENSSYFGTPEQLFFSRRIADPGAGIRVTGKAGRWAFAGLGINDRRPGQSAEAGDPMSGKSATIGVGRLQYEFGKNSRVGATLTARDFGPSSNLVAGADARIQLDANWSATGQLVRSRTIDSDGRRTSGNILFVELARRGRHFDWTGTYVGIGRDFSAELGYVRRTDMQELSQEVSYAWRRDQGLVVSFGPEISTSALWDSKGRIQDWNVSVDLDLELRGQTQFGLGFERSSERYGGIDFGHRTLRLWSDTNWLSWLGANLSLQAGTSTNYYPAEGLAPALSNAFEAEGGVTIRPSPRIKIDQIYLYSRLSARSGSEGLPVAAIGTIFSNHILRTRVDYQFSRPLSLRAIVDYDGLLADPRAVALTKERHLKADVLLTYMINPWTAFYLGYTDGYQDLAKASLPGRPSGWDGWTSTGRQIFTKVSYLIRY